METRPIKELLQIMLDNIDLMRIGLCSLVHDLEYSDILTNDEATILYEHIETINLPINSKVKLRYWNELNKEFIMLSNKQLCKQLSIKSLLPYNKYLNIKNISIYHFGNKKNRILYLKEQISLLNKITYERIRWINSIKYSK